MNTNVKNISDNIVSDNIVSIILIIKISVIIKYQSLYYQLVDNIREKLTDYQYKTIMDNLMALNNNKIEDWNAHMMNLYDRGSIF